ncbi:hypothetical protein ASPZODRAFT_992052 [Penicilliopsis zonata CBS 506.65]|uniref:Uncharacterized protein n=1 Tax=Penicilliopsis zonata CBS 506.65 TaxID=1073090 RepID=A0A1L9SR03_9EURO|nr:hypothetical protein ASPZODRAFT_992052 [Penicilliopsis zonata CBS 506.65]OJJ49650.1 hypothetical protein ASPZODRAFT_992052 [Penicilliopsis zonata CBS 506.65]
MCVCSTMDAVGGIPPLQPWMRFGSPGEGSMDLKYEAEIARSKCAGNSLAVKMRDYLEAILAVEVELHMPDRLDLGIPPPPYEDAIADLPPAYSPLARAKDLCDESAPERTDTQTKRIVDFDGPSGIREHKGKKKKGKGGGGGGGGGNKNGGGNNNAAGSDNEGEKESPPPDEGQNGGDAPNDAGDGNNNDDTVKTGMTFRTRPARRRRRRRRNKPKRRRSESARKRRSG